MIAVYLKNGIRIYFMLTLENICTKIGKIGGDCIYY